MLGDIWCIRSHPRNWFKRFMVRVITFIKHGRHTPENHIAFEMEEGGLLLEFDDDRKLARIPCERYFGSGHSVRVFRLAGLDGKDLQALYNEALKLIGYSYSVETLIAHLGGRRFAARVARMNVRDLICSEVAARIYKNAIGLHVRRRHSIDYLSPEEVRPRDWSWTCQQAPWELIVQTTHGIVVPRKET